MNKQNKSLSIIAIVLTALAVITWSLYFFNQTENDTETLPHTGGEGALINEISSFALEFETPEVQTTQGNTVQIPIILDGQTSEIVSSELVLSYNSKDIRIVDIKERNLFDFYIGKVIDQDNGKTYLSGALTDVINKNTGTFAILEVEKLSEGPTSIKIVGAEEVVKNPNEKASSAVTFLEINII